MMKRVLPLLFLGLLFFACQKDITQEQQGLSHLPASADMVLAFDVPQLMEKADFDGFRQMPVYQEFIREIAEENSAFAKIVENPSTSGLDLDKQFFISMERLDLSKEEIVVVLPIADSTAFREMINKADKDDKIVSQGVNHIQHRNSAMSWNDRFAVLVNNDLADDPKSRSEALLNLQEKESITSNDNIFKLLDEQADIAVWMSSSLIITNKKATEELVKLLGVSPEDLYENYLHTYLNFEKGAIKAKTSYFLKPVIANDLDLLFKDNPETNFANKVPANGLKMLLTAGLELKGINQLLIEKHIKGSAQQFTDEYGIAFEELIEASNGDIAFAIYENVDTTDIAPDYQGLFATTIENQEQLQVLLQQAEEKTRIGKLDDQTYELLSLEAGSKSDSSSLYIKTDLEGYIYLKDDQLYIVSHESLLNELKAGNFETENAITNRLAKVSMENIFAMVTNWEIDDSVNSRNPMEMIREDLMIESNRQRSQFTIRTKNAEENSLKSLLKIINEDYEKDQAEKEQKI